MTIYLLNLFSIPFYAFFLRCVFFTEEKQRRWLCWIVGIQLFLTAALRHVSVGGDLENYVPAFKYIGELSWRELVFVPFETGYVVLNKVVYLLAQDIRLLLVIIGGFVVFGYVRMIYQNSVLPWVSLLFFIGLGFFTESLSMLRQAIAMVIFIYGLKYVVAREFGKYLLIVLLATSFHLTAIVTLLLYPFVRFRLNVCNFIIIFIGCGVLALLVGPFVLDYIISHFYSLYSSQMDSGGGFSMLILLLAVTIGVLLLWKKREDNWENLFVHMLVLACCMQLFALQFALFARIVMYFSMSMIICVPNMLVKIENKEFRFLSTSVACLLAVVYFIFIILGRNAAGIAPYYFMWE